jgi:hypothetical protein
MATTIYCAYNGTAITAVYGVDISEAEWIVTPEGYTSMPSTDARYAAWYAGLPDVDKALAVPPGD